MFIRGITPGLADGLRSLAEGRLRRQLGNILRKMLTFARVGASWERQGRSRGGQRARSRQFSSHKALSAAPLSLS